MTTPLFRKLIGSEPVEKASVQPVQSVQPQPVEKQKPVEITIPWTFVKGVKKP